LNEHKEEIERSFGKPLVWDRLDNKRASVIRYFVSDYGHSDREKWPELQELLIDCMVRFDQTFRTLISQSD
jgi:hypothetical protein